MKKKYLVAGILAILLVSITGAFALTSTQTRNEAMGDVDEMHRQMTANIQDPELKQAMDEMHKEHMEDKDHVEKMALHHNGQNGAGNGSMMGGTMGMH